MDTSSNIIPILIRSLIMTLLAIVTISVNSYIQKAKEAKDDYINTLIHLIINNICPTSESLKHIKESISQNYDLHLMLLPCEKHAINTAYIKCMSSDKISNEDKIQFISNGIRIGKRFIENDKRQCFYFPEWTLMDFLLDLITMTGIVTIITSIFTLMDFYNKLSDIPIITILLYVVGISVVITVTIYIVYISLRWLRTR